MKIRKSSKIYNYISKPGQFVRVFLCFFNFYMLKNLCYRKTKFLHLLRMSLYKNRVMNKLTILRLNKPMEGSIP